MFLQNYAKKHNMKFKDAMKPAGKAWKSHRGHRGGNPGAHQGETGGSTMQQPDTTSPTEGGDKEKEGGTGEQSSSSPSSPSSPPSSPSSPSPGTSGESEPQGVGGSTTENFAMFGGKRTKGCKKHKRRKSKKH